MAFNGHTIGLVVLVALQAANLQRGDSMTGLIVGQVIDAENGRPIRGALVAIGGPLGPGPVPPPRILTGSDGRFVFSSLRRGNYTITAQKGGFVDGAYGRTRPAGPSLPLSLQAGERTGDATIQLWRHAVISGTVVDESGEALIGVRVQAYRRGVVAGERRYIPSGFAATDDRGVYRIAGLIPGDFIVGATARHVALPAGMANDLGLEIMRIGSNATLMPVGDGAYVFGAGTPTPPPMHAGHRLAIYPPTFHPQSPSGDAATVIALHAGQEYVNADLQLSPVPTVGVSGQVVGPEGPVTTTALRLVASHTIEIGIETESLATMTDRAGRFTFPAVPSGNYSLRLLRGTQPSRQTPGPEVNMVLWTDLPVNVGNETIENLVVEAQPGLRVSGRIEFEGSGRTRLPWLTDISVSIERADHIPGNLSSDATGRVDSSGGFRSTPIAGGRYYIRIANSPAGWMFKSATVDGRDVSDTPISIAADLANVTVTFTDRWSGIRGQVQSRQGPDGTAAVLVFPTDTSSWASSGTNPRRVRMVRAGKTGEYSLNLPPGEYYVTAVPDARAADWQDPAFMEAASRSAARVNVIEGERRVQDLTTRDVR